MGSNLDRLRGLMEDRDQRIEEAGGGRTPAASSASADPPGMARLKAAMSGAAKPTGFQAADHVGQQLKYLKYLDTEQRGMETVGLSQDFGPQAMRQLQRQNQQARELAMNTVGIGPDFAQNTYRQVQQYYTPEAQMQRALSGKGAQIGAQIGQLDSFAQQYQDLKKEAEQKQAVANAASMMAGMTDAEMAEANRKRIEADAAADRLENYHPETEFGTDDLKRSLTWLMKYAPLSQNEDYAEKSQYTPEPRDVKKDFHYYYLSALSGGASEKDAWRNPTYEAINGNIDAAGAVGADLWNKGTRLGAVNYGKMTKDERERYNYIYHTQGSAEAQRFLDWLTRELNRRDREDTEAWARGIADGTLWGDVKASLLSIAMAPVKGIGYYEQALAALDGNLDPNAGYNRLSYTQQAIRGQVSENITNSMARQFGEDIANAWAPWTNFGYQTAMSMGDFLLNTAVGGGFSGAGDALVLAIMGTGAAADATMEAKERGVSDGWAFALGTIAGAAEIVTEKVSLETLLDKSALGKEGFMRYLAKNILAEGSEEGASDLINWYADGLYEAITHTGKSEWETMIREIQAANPGMSREEAFGVATAHRLEELGWDIGGGMFSGGVMAGGSGLINAAQNRWGKARNGQNGNSTGGETIPPIAEKTPEADRTETQRIYEALGLETPETMSAGLARQRQAGYNDRVDRLIDTFVNDTMEGEQGNGVFQGTNREDPTSDAGAQATVGDRSGVQERMRGISRDDGQIRDADGEGHGRLTVAEEEAQRLHENNITTHLVSSENWTHRQDAFTRNGEVYLRSDIPEKFRGMVAAHEITHAMKQLGYQPYLGFIERTPEMLDPSDINSRKLLQGIADDRDIDPLTASNKELLQLYDELNATVYGHIASGKVDKAMDAGLRSAFYDFDAYAAELRSIHEQFKRSRSPGNTQLNNASAEGTENNPFGAVHSGRSGYSQLLEAYRNNSTPTAADEYALLASAFPGEDADYFSALGIEPQDSTKKEDDISVKEGYNNAQEKTAVSRDEMLLAVQNTPCELTEQKFSGFFLKPGAKHADEFFSVGYTPSDVLRLQYDIARQFNMDKAVEFGKSKDGKERFNTYMMLGIGQQRRFCIGWLIDSPDSIPRIITGFRKDR